MTIPRRYSVSEIKEFVDLLQQAPEVGPEKIAGMTELISILAHFECMTDEQIDAEIRATYKTL